MIGVNGPMSALMSVSLNRVLHSGVGGGDGQDAEVAKFCWWSDWSVLKLSWGVVRQTDSQSDSGRSWRRSFWRRRRCAMASPTCCQTRMRRTHLGKKKMLQSLSLHGPALLRGATRVRVLIVPVPVTVRSPCLDVEVFLCPSFWRSGIAEMIRTGSNFCFEFFVVCVHTRLLFAVGCPVGWSSWGIPCTTKDPHSQKKSGIVTTCAAFCHPQLFLRNSR